MVIKAMDCKVVLNGEELNIYDVDIYNPPNFSDFMEHMPSEGTISFDITFSDVSFELVFMIDDLVAIADYYTVESDRIIFYEEAENHKTEILQNDQHEVFQIIVNYLIEVYPEKQKRV